METRKTPEEIMLLRKKKKILGEEKIAAIKRYAAKLKEIKRKKLPN